MCRRQLQTERSCCKIDLNEPLQKSLTGLKAGDVDRRPGQEVAPRRNLAERAGIASS